MSTPLCEEFGIEYPIFAFTPSEHVAAAVSRAGGLGVLGCVRFNETDELEKTLSWLDDNTDGKPYGVDIVMPMKIPTEGTSIDLKAMIPDEHISFVEKTLQKLGVPPLPEGEGRDGVLGWLHSIARSHLDVALKHRPVLIANALGSPPKDVIDLCHEHGIKVAALGRCRDARVSATSTTASTSSSRRASRPVGTPARSPAWCSPPTSSTRSDPTYPSSAPAASAPAGRSRPRSRWAPRGCGPARSGSAPRSTSSSLQRGLDHGVHAGHLRRHRPHPHLHRQAGPSAEDEVDGSLGGGRRPAPLPMPLQNILVSEAHNRINASGDPDVISMPIGQIVGRMNDVRPVAEVMADLVAEFEEAVKRLGEIAG